MYISKEVFLSEASWRIEPRLGFVNLVNAPMASGKTTWARNFNAEGITLLLVPTVALAKQLEAAGWKYVKLKTPGLFTKWEFGGLPQPKLILYVATIQDFILHKPDDLRNIRTVFIDEVDWVLLDAAKWGGDNKPKIEEAFRWLIAHSNDFIIIAYSATGMELVANKLAGFGRVCETNEPLRNLQREFAEYYTPGLWLLSNPDKPVLIYSKFLKRCKILKAMAEKAGFTVGVLTGSNPSPASYTLTQADKDLRHAIESTQTIPPHYNCIIVNDGANRGLNIKNKHIYDVLVDSKWDERGYTQAHGRLRYHDVKVWIQNGNTAEIVEPWLPPALHFHNSEKELIVAMFNFRNGKNAATYHKFKTMCETYFNYVFTSQGEYTTMRKSSRVLGAGFGAFTPEETERIIKEEVEQGIIPLYHLTKQIEHKNVYLNPKNGAQTSYPAWTDVEPMDFGDLVPPKIEETQTAPQIATSTFELDEWYDIKTLKNMLHCANKEEVAKHVAKLGYSLKEGQPTIDGKRSRRYKII